MDGKNETTFLFLGPVTETVQFCYSDKPSHRARMKYMSTILMYVICVIPQAAVCCKT